MDNRILYEQERDMRWEMADRKEPEAIETIRHMLSDILEKKVRIARYDEYWFERFDPGQPENRWVRGASDYVLKIDGGEDGPRYLYAEIKIKSVKFRKTVRGGRTQKGSEIAAYGCESFYLDIDPVYKNMCVFVRRLAIDSGSFLLFFIDEELTEVYAISLREIQDLIDNGYRSMPICIFSEGYGTKTECGPALNYLIPVDAAHKVGRGIAGYIWEHGTKRLALEKDLHGL